MSNKVIRISPKNMERREIKAGFYISQQEYLSLIKLFKYMIFINILNQ